MSSSSDSPVVNGDSSAANSGPTKGKNHATTNGVATVPNGLIRRSNRRQKVRGEKEIIVSSDMLLRDLKVKVSSGCGSFHPGSTKRTGVLLGVLGTCEILVYVHVVLVQNYVLLPFIWIFRLPVRFCLGTCKSGQIGTPAG